MRSANFSFLEAYDPLLLRYAALAERYVYDDPNGSLLKTRQFAELLAQHAAGAVGHDVDGEDRFLDVLRLLRRERVTTRKVEDWFHAIRKAGNRAAHNHEDDEADAIHQLKLARHLAVWFHRTIGRARDFRAGSFELPPRDADAPEALEAEVVALEADRLERLRRWSASLRLDLDLHGLDARSRDAAAELELDESDARRRIDAWLREAGWPLQDGGSGYADGARPAEGEACAIADWPTAEGSVDYVLFDGLAPRVVVEATHAEYDVAAALEKARHRARSLLDLAGDAAWGDGQRTPFVAAATGEAWEPHADAGGVLWADARATWATPRRVSGFHDPASVRRLLQRPVAPPYRGPRSPLPPALASAAAAVERALDEGRRNVLVALPPGTGRTTLAVAIAAGLRRADADVRVLVLTDYAGSKRQLVARLAADAPSADVATFAEACGDRAASEELGAYDVVLVDEGLSPLVDAGLDPLEELLTRYDAARVVLTCMASEPVRRAFGEPVYSLSVDEAVETGLLRPVHRATWVADDEATQVAQLAAHLDPLLPDKTLVIARDDEHARALCEGYGAALEAAGRPAPPAALATWTSDTDDVGALVQRLRNEAWPSVVFAGSLPPPHITMAPLRRVVVLRDDLDDATIALQEARASRPRGDFDDSVAWCARLGAEPSETPVAVDAAWTAHVAACVGAVCTGAAPVDAAWVRRLARVWHERGRLDDSVLAERRYAAWWPARREALTPLVERLVAESRRQ